MAASRRVQPAFWRPDVRYRRVPVWNHVRSGQGVGRARSSPRSKVGRPVSIQCVDAMEHNELGQLTHQTIASYFDKDPPTFYEIPFGYHDQDEIKTEVVAKVGTANRAEDAGTGLVQGNPVAMAIAERDLSLLPVITKAVAQAIAGRFGEQTFVLR